MKALAWILTFVGLALVLSLEWNRPELDGKSSPSAVFPRGSAVPALQGGLPPDARGDAAPPDYQDALRSGSHRPAASAAGASPDAAICLDRAGPAFTKSRHRRQQRVDSGTPLSRELSPAGTNGRETDTVSGPVHSLTEEGSFKNVEQASFAPPTQPAALIDIGHEAVSSPEARERLDEIAREFTESLTESGLDPESEEYRGLWDEQQIATDARFRSMYGGQAWSQHHIQSHHSANPVTVP